MTRHNGQYHIVGAAWGAPIQRVEVQIDGGPWMPATIDRSQDAGFAWEDLVYRLGEAHCRRAYCHHAGDRYRGQ